jgi:hypothetical protein
VGKYDATNRNWTQIQKDLKTFEANIPQVLTELKLFWRGRVSREKKNLRNLLSYPFLPIQRSPATIKNNILFMIKCLNKKVI